MNLIFKNTALFIFLALSTLTVHAQDKFQPKMPTSVVADLDRAVTVRRAGDLQTAILSIEKIIAVNNNYYRAHYNLGLAYTDAGKTEKGLNSLKNADAIRQKESISDPTLDNSIGWSYLLLSDLDNAERYFQVAIDKSANLSRFSKARVYNNMAQVKIYKKDYVSAKKFLNLAIANGSSVAKNTLRLINSEN